MREYVKPEMNIDEFVPEVSITSCENTSEYNAVTVYCLAEGSEQVFNGDTCNIDVTGSVGTGWTIITYNNLDYFVWTKDGGGYGDKNDVDGNYLTSSITSTSMDLLNTVQKYGLKNGYLTNKSGTAYHIARMNSNIVSRLNQS